MEISLKIYRHRHHHVTIPNVQIQMHERDTGNDWLIRGSIDIAYFLRFGELIKNPHGGESFEADLMCRRLECSLLVGARQFVQFEPEGGAFLSKLEFAPFEASFLLGNLPDLQEGSSVADWFAAFSQHNWLRRAAEDLHTAMKLPSEDMLFMFRAFEWLQKGLECGWSDLGAKVDVPQVNLTRLKKDANSWDTAARHAVPSGHKLHFGEDAMPTWIQGALHAIVHARAAVDTGYAQWLKDNKDPYPI